MDELISLNEINDAIDMDSLVDAAYEVAEEKYEHGLWRTHDLTIEFDAKELEYTAVFTNNRKGKEERLDLRIAERISTALMAGRDIRAARQDLIHELAAFIGGQ